MLVPLIPADELPFSVRLQGVPRILRFDHTVGMQHVGIAPYTGMQFKLEEGSMFPQHLASQQAGASTMLLPFEVHRATGISSFSKQLSRPDTVVHQMPGQRSLNRNAAATQPSPTSSHEAATWWRMPSINTIDKTQTMIDAITSSDAQAADIGNNPKSTPIPPSGILPDQDKKEYCTYWIRHGGCDYMQQGCMFKHEMPDRATLAKIGIKSVPRWWVEKNRKVHLRSNDERKASVGPVVSSSVWLSKKLGEDSSSDGDDESDSSESDEDSQGGTHAKVAKDLAAVPSTPESAEEDVQAETPETKTVITTSGPNEREAFTHKPSATPSDTRKASKTSDLIDFAPLIPSSSSSTPALTPSTSGSSSPKMGRSTPLTRRSTPLPTPHRNTDGGNDTASAKNSRHASRQHVASRSTQPPSTLSSAGQARGNKQAPRVPKTIKAENVGLMARGQAPHSAAAGARASTRGPPRAREWGRRAATKSQTPARGAKKEGAGQ